MIDVHAESTYKAADAMAERGGSFVKELGAAWYCADPLNKKKLCKAFHNYFIEYGAKDDGKPEVEPLYGDLYEHMNKVNRIMCALTNGHCFLHIGPSGSRMENSSQGDMKAILDFFGMENMEDKNGKRTPCTKEKCDAFNKFFKAVGRGISAEWNETGEGIPFKFKTDIDERIFLQFMADILDVRIDRKKLLWDSPEGIHLGELAWVTGYLKNEEPSESAS